MHDAVGNAPFRSLRASVNSVLHGAALHEYDGMMPILARDGRGQGEDISLRTPSATSREIEVAFLSSRTRTTVPSRMSRTIGSSASGRLP